MQLGFYFDQTRCIGCYTCSVACKDWNNIKAGPVRWRRIITIEKGRFPNIFVAFLSLSCLHCANPSCISVCPEGAIFKREQDGIVVVNSDRCRGKSDCGLCKDACPYDAPQFESGDSSTMQMCNFCMDRWERNQKPICVTACRTRALDAGPLDQLRARYGDLKEAPGFIYSAENNPSIILKPKAS